MQKPGLSSGRRRRPIPNAAAILPDTLEGQIGEICQEMAVQVKRMRQLQEQAEELRTTLRQWLVRPNRFVGGK
jgi:hypothetical protein